MVTRTALKCTGLSPTVVSLVEASTVRAIAGAAGGLCPAAGAALLFVFYGAAAPTRTGDLLITNQAVFVDFQREDREICPKLSLP